MYNPSISSRPLPNPSLQSGKYIGEDQVKSRKVQVHSQWNNTYERVEEKIGGTTYVNQRF